MKQMQEALAAIRIDSEKTVGDRAQPLSATDVERTVYVVDSGGGGRHFVSRSSLVIDTTSSSSVCFSKKMAMNYVRIMNLFHSLLKVVVVDDYGQRIREAWDELQKVRGDLEKDLSAVPQLGYFRQKVREHLFNFSIATILSLSIIMIARAHIRAFTPSQQQQHQIVKHLKQLVRSLREEERFRSEMAEALDDCLNSLVSLRVHMEQRKRDRGDEDSSSSKDPASNSSAPK